MDKKQNKILPFLPINLFIDIFKKNIEDIVSGADGEDNVQLIKLISQSMENSTNGDLKERERFKQYLKTRLLTGINIFDFRTSKREPEFIETLVLENSKDLLDNIMPFNNSKLLTPRDKFEILLHKYRSINNIGYDKAFKLLKEKYPSYIKRSIKRKISNKWFEYTAEDIEKIYQEENISLNSDEKADIITNRLYSEIFGLGCIDILAYSDVNEVGISNDGKYIYCWEGEKIHLSFLELTEKQTMIIQDRSISFDRKVGQLDSNNCEVLCYRKDNARITAAQPPYSSSRVLCIRIFNQSTSTFSDVVKDEKQQELIINLIKIGSNIVLQGELGAGKTTGMQTLLEILDDRLHIGTVEDYFEQHNRLKYLNKRVVEFQTTENKDLMDAIMTLFRMSVDVASIGEARDGVALFGFIQLAQAIANSTLFTTHVASPEDSVPRFKNMLISTGKYHSEQAAVTDIVNYINIIFQHKIIDNKRYISEIVEVVPLMDRQLSHDLSMNTDIELLQKMAYIQQIQQNPMYMYRLNPLMVLENGVLKFKNLPSKYTIEKSRKNSETQQMMQELLELMKQNIDSV